MFIISLKKAISLSGLIYISLSIVSCYPEQGIWNDKLIGNKEWYQSVVVTKSMFSKGQIITSIVCNPQTLQETISLNVTWYLRKASCWKEYFETEPVASSPTAIFRVLEKPSSKSKSVYTSGSEIITCDGNLKYLTKSSSKLSTRSDVLAAQKQKDAKNKAAKAVQWKLNPVAVHRKRRALETTVSSISSSTSASLSTVEWYDDYDPLVGEDVEVQSLPSKTGSAHKEPLFIVPNDGIYQFIIGTKVYRPHLSISNDSYTADLHIEMYNDYGYLSAADYPLLIFYSTMCVIYVIYGVCWLTVSFMRWRELLRVQYWIGAVIFLGMLEKAVFTAEYESVNKKGVSVPGLIVFAELVSCAKRTLSRMLVIIVSFGFGIVKPRLGIVLHRVIGVGSIYFLLASIEGCMRALRPKIPNDEYSRRLLFAIIPLALLESAICWWVFSALVSTTRTLRLRRNTIKLDLFKHFTNTLVFAVVTSVIFMLWSIKYHNFDECLSDWKQIWVNDAFWHVLFAIILLVIMILWRPTNNNQRFAFSPLLDEGSEGEEEEQEKLMSNSNVSENMKFRNSRHSSSSSPKVSHSLEDDLKWVEENIPSSLADTGLPIMDSDEEILTTRFEISKMQ